MTSNINQSKLWERMNIKLSYIRKVNKPVFVPKVIVRKAC